MEGTPIDADMVRRMYNMALAAHACSSTAEAEEVGEQCENQCNRRRRPKLTCGDDPASVRVTPLTGLTKFPQFPGVRRCLAMATTTDPSMLQVAISYAFGDTSVGLSWYQVQRRGDTRDRS